MEIKNAENVIVAATEKQQVAQKSKTAANIMGDILNAEATKKLLKNTLKENAGAFSASILDLYNTDYTLQKCDPRAVFGECLKAASLKLPINKQLGFAYVVPYKSDGKSIPQFQIGYKGLIQLALRTGAYRYINAGPVYEGEFKSADKLTGEVDLSGEKVSDEVVGYFAYIETTNGFKKALYWTKKKVTKHASDYSKSYQKSNSAWATKFDEMATKTVLRNLLSHYGYMSIEMANSIDAEDNVGEASAILQSNENKEIMDSIVIEAEMQDIEAGAEVG